jgi:hypothetical protein
LCCSRKNGKDILPRPWRFFSLWNCRLAIKKEEAFHFAPPHLPTRYVLSSWTGWFLVYLTTRFQLNWLCGVEWYGWCEYCQLWVVKLCKEEVVACFKVGLVTEIKNLSTVGLRAEIRTRDISNLKQEFYAATLYIWEKKNVQSKKRLLAFHIIKSP